MNDLPPLVDQSNDNKKTIVILLLVMGVICLFTLGAISVAFYTLNTVKQEQKSHFVTEQADATSTAVYHATQVAGYEFFDDFDDNKNGWETGYGNEYWQGSINILDGAYVWDIKEFHGVENVSSWQTYKDSKLVTDFDLFVDAKQATPDAQHLCYAVAFRASPTCCSTGGYEFHICGQQFYVAYYGNSMDDSKVFSSWTPSKAIRLGEWNTLGIKARGDHFTLSINNAVVNEFTDTRRRNGYIYLMIRYYDTVPGIIMFDNFGLQLR